MTVNTRIFDARNRFLRKGREIPRPEHEQGAADRAQSQQLEAQGLRDEFKRAPKFNEQDRKTLVRNLGRLIERKFPDDFRRVAGEVLRTAFGEEGGLSAEKSANAISGLMVSGCQTTNPANIWPTGCSSSKS